MSLSLKHKHYAIKEKVQVIDNNISELFNNKQRTITYITYLLILIKNWIHDWQLTIAVRRGENHLIPSPLPSLKYHNNNGCHYRQGDVNLSSVRKLLRTDSHW